MIISIYAVVLLVFLWLIFSRKNTPMNYYIFNMPTSSPRMEHVIEFQSEASFVVGDIVSNFFVNGGNKCRIVKISSSSIRPNVFNVELTEVV